MRAHRLPRQELDELASRIVRREIYLAHVDSGPGFEHPFGWLFALMEEPMSKSQIASIGACYEEMSKALPRGINGYPMFPSCRFLHVDDVMPLHKRIMKKERSLEDRSLRQRLMFR